MFRLINQAGLTIETIHDGIGFGHSIVTCKFKDQDSPFVTPIISGNEIQALLPQRPPIIMVDQFYGMDETGSYSSLTIDSDNLFVRNGQLDECGLIEHIAQSAAARIGY